MVCKQRLLKLSNVASLGVAAFASMATWSHSAFKTFVASANPWFWLVLFFSEQLFKLAMVAVGAWTRRKDQQKKVSAGPTASEANAMRLFTAAFDYLFVGGMFLFFSSTVFVANEPLCPFRSTCVQCFLAAGLLAKEEIQCRALWSTHISPRKINTWPYTLDSMMKHFCSTFWTFCILSTFTFFSNGHADVAFQSGIVGLLFTCSRIWLETMAVLLAVEVPNLLHPWMHKKGYFLHKRHHERNQNLTMEGANQFDNVDVVIEFYVAVPIVIVLKWALGLAPTIHFFSFSLFFVLAFQLHSGNPYATYFFNPFLDHCMRPTLCHNLHHAVQVGYYTQIPFHHLFNKKARTNDIALYNKHMETNFPMEI